MMKTSIPQQCLMGTEGAAHNPAETQGRPATSLQRWPMSTRVLIGILVAQIAALTITFVLGPVLRAHLRMDVLLVALIGMAALGAALTYALIGRMLASHHARIAQIRRLVETQAPPAGTEAASSPTPADELELLAVGLNRLLAVHRESVQQISRRADTLATLNLIAATINRTFDLEEVFVTAQREALSSMGWDMGAIWLWDPRAKQLNMVSFTGLSEDAVRQMFAYGLGEGPTGQAARTHQIVVVEDIRKHPDYAGKSATGLPITQINLPLASLEGELLGVLLIGNSSRATPTEESLNLLATVAHQVSMAIEKTQLYAQVKQHARELENVVKARTEELARAIDDLEDALEHAREADKVKSLLLSTVSHELRTPLATIKGSASLLREHYHQLAPEMLAEHLRDIEEEADKLTELIDNLLDMSRIEAGILHIRREAVDLKHMLEATVSAAQMRHGEHPIYLTLPARLPMGFGDARRLEQVVANLLDNAAKFSPAGKPIEVSAAAGEDEVVISVKDYGIGIPEDQRERIFDRFYQISGRGDASRHGIGLGLAICRGLVEAHEGRIWVESVVGEGSTFSFSVPIATPERLYEGGRHEGNHYLGD